MRIAILAGVPRQSEKGYPAAWKMKGPTMPLRGRTSLLSVALRVARGRSSGSHAKTGNELDTRFSSGAQRKFDSPRHVIALSEMNVPHHRSLIAGRLNADASFAVWQNLIGALTGSCGGRLPQQRTDEYRPARHVYIRVLERLSADSIVVLWKDATRCHYNDQIWIRCRARIRGECAICGAAIRRNDIVYKPRVRGHTVINARAMILEREVTAQGFDRC